MTDASAGHGFDGTCRREGDETPPEMEDGKRMAARALNRGWIVLLAGWVLLAVCRPDAFAQAKDPRAAARLPGVRVGRDAAATPEKRPPAGPIRARTSPTAPGATVPRLPRPGEGLERPTAPIPPGDRVAPPAAPGAAGGVIKKDAGDLPPGFDPARLGKPEDAATPGAAGPAGDDERGIEDMIEFKSVYERGIKCRRVPLSTKISIDFEEAPLDDVIKFIGCITAKNFIITKALGKAKTITIMSPEPVTAYEAYKVFLVALEMNGMTVVPAGKFLKIIEIAAAKQDILPLIGPGRAVPDDERLVTRMIQLEHVDANELQQVLSKFKTKYGDITVYAPTNTIFVTDLGTNIKRLLRLVKELDVPVGRERVWVRQVEYATATELVDKLMGVFGPQGTTPARPGQPAAGRPAPPKPGPQPGGAVVPSVTTVVGESAGGEQVTKILADDRTNQLIVVATRTAYYKLDKLIRKLDVPIPGEGAIHIHYLENADSEELSQTLSSLVSGQAQRPGAAKAGARPAARPGAPAAAGAATAAALFEGDVKITAHKATNSLVIQASLKDYTSLKKVIEKLDVRRKQVYVEAIIMEISSSKDRNIGFSGSGGTTFDVGGDTVPLLLGMGGLGISGLDTSQLTKGGFAAGLQGPLLDVSAGSGTSDTGVSGTLSIPSFGFLIQAIQSNSDVNILSTPHILTTDNEEAEIQVGKQIPYMAQGSGMSGLSGLGGLGGLAGMSGLGSTLGAGGLGGSALSLLGGLGGYGTVQRIDVDLTLKITPHVNESNYVKLEIDQQIDDVESIDRTLGPTTSKRHVTNVVVVKDQQPVVIGGLIRDTESEGVDKVPLLGDIPLLGMLFRKTVTRYEKRNLLMIIIPHIIDDPAVDLKRIHEQKLAEMERYQTYMATRQKEFRGEIDYEKKHGLLEEMHQAVDDAREEREMIERSVFEESELDTVGPPETHDLEYDPYGATPPKRGEPKAGEPGDDEHPVQPGSASGAPEDEEPPAEPLL